MGDVKVSIIVPVFNVEKYIRKCLDSIVHQSLREIEIIVVNDGSSDSSPEILGEYAARDGRIKLINQENTGLSSARNAGLKVAKGEYIGFVDSDDFIEENMYERMYQNAKRYESDVVMCPAYVFDDNNPDINFEKTPYFSLERLDERFDNRAFDHTVTGDLLFKINVTCWNKLYRSQFLNDTGARFREMYFEDNVFFFETYLKAGRISLIRDFSYYYRINRAGSVIDHGNEKLFDVCKMQDILKDLLIETGNLDRYLDGFLNYKVDGCMGRLNQVDEHFKPEFFEIIKMNFEKNNFNQSDIDKLPGINRIKFQNVMLSDTYNEYELI